MHTLVSAMGRDAVKACETAVEISDETTELVTHEEVAVSTVEYCLVGWDTTATLLLGIEAAELTGVWSGADIVTGM